MLPQDFEQLCETYGKTIARMDIIRLVCGANSRPYKSDLEFRELHAKAREIYLIVNPGGFFPPLTSS
jgi:hypothetical protein